MLLTPNVNWLAVLVAAVVGFVISWLWWGPLFGKSWIKYSGISAAQAKKMHKQCMGGKMTIAFIAQLVMAWVLAALIFEIRVVSMMEGVVLALHIWLGFVAAIGVGMVLWENKPWGLFWVNMIGWLVTLIVMSIVLVMMG
jgi:hypothetical protein